MLRPTPALPVETYRRVHDSFICEECGERTLLSMLALRHKPNCKAVGGVTALRAHEKELALLIAEGKTTKEMAECLGITHGNVCKRRAYLYRRLGINSAVELVALLYQYRILLPKEVTQ